MVADAAAWDAFVDAVEAEEDAADAEAAALAVSPYIVFRALLPAPASLIFFRKSSKLLSSCECNIGPRGF